jgi:hypothetical protein
VVIITTPGNSEVGFLLIGIVSIFFLVAPRALNFTGFLPSKPQVLVEYLTVVQEYIAGSEAKRQHHLYYLDGNTKQYDDISRFRQLFTPAQQRMDEKAQHALGLLATGDIVLKAANITALRMLRGDSTSLSRNKKRGLSKLPA